MLNNKVKIAIGIGVLIGLILIGYFTRIDRFGMSKISWVDCMQINDTKYYSDYNRTPIEKSLLGEKIGKVKFNVAMNVNNSSYHFRNGDATFLDVGTEIYSLKSVKNAIAVKVGEAYYIYKDEFQ